MGYVRIEAERAGAAQRIFPNSIRDNRRCDGREDEVIVRAERDKNNARAWKTGDEGLNRLCPEFKKKGNACA